MRRRPGSNLMTSGPPASGRNAIGTFLSKSKTVINSFSSQERNARWCSGSSATVISLAFPNRIATDDLVRRGIDYRKNILVLQVHVHLARDGIVLRHSRFAVEVQGSNDFVVLHVHHRFRFTSFV